MIFRMTKTLSIENMNEEELHESLKTSREGLTDSEANSRLAKLGPNILQNEAKRSVPKLIVKQFKSSLIYLLIVASLLSFALRDLSDGIVIAVVLVINTSLGFYQEYKSEKAVDKLQKLIRKQILVTRNGKDTLVPETLVTIGDLVILREGDIVPADIRLIDVESLSVNESQLTGESMPVAKSDFGDNSTVFAGSVIEKGEGKGYVFAVAGKTQLGKIAHLSSSTKRVTQFEQSLVSFSNLLVKVTFLTLICVFVIKILISHDFSHIGALAIFIIALAIAVVPEAMPVIVTVTLSKGALNLAEKHVIAKTLSAVEDLGNINILCSDKTGTLTENKQTVKKLYAEDKDLFEYLSIVSLETSDEKRKRFQSSFDKAFLGYVPESIQERAYKAERLEELPFDPAARRRRVIYSDSNKYYLVEVGSVETLLEITQDKDRERYANIIKEEGRSGLRHLAIAYKEINYKKGTKFDILKHEDGLKFVGFVSLEDPLRPSARHTISLAQKLGVGIKILSGDSREVTHYVSSEVGLLGKGQVVYTGEEIDKMDDDELSGIVYKNNAFARLNPEQKYRIIRLLKLHGNVVGYQGDGINDAPALKLADVAIAVNNASDVAQESADILLLRADLGVIVNGIHYGRQIFININKYIRYTMIGNFGNFFALGALYLISASLPLLTIQLLLTNLLGDIPLINIATDNVEQSEVGLPSKYNTRGILLTSMFLGSFTAMFELFFYSIVKNHSLGMERTSLFLYLTLLGLIIILSVRNKDHFWKAPRLTKQLKISFGIITLITFAVVYAQPFKRIFYFNALPLNLLITTVAMTIFYLLILDTIKVWFYKSSVGGESQ